MSNIEEAVRRVMREKGYTWADAWCLWIKGNERVSPEDALARYKAEQKPTCKCESCRNGMTDLCNGCEEFSKFLPKQPGLLTKEQMPLIAQAKDSLSPSEPLEGIELFVAEFQRDADLDKANAALIAERRKLADKLDTFLKDFDAWQERVKKSSRSFQQVGSDRDIASLKGRIKAMEHCREKLKPIEAKIAELRGEI